MQNKILYNLKKRVDSYISKLKEDIDTNIFLVIKNIEYYNLFNFYVFLFIIFGKKKL